jgi:hypothetical protein
MLSRFRAELRRPSPAFVLSLIALFVALGGTGAYAIDKVTSSQIANGGVQRIDLHRNAVAAKQVKDESLGGGELDFQPVIATNGGSIPANGSQEIVAECGSGQLATGGGYLLGTPTPPGISERSSLPNPLQDGQDADGWSVTFENSSGTPGSAGVVALCVPE